MARESFIPLIGLAALLGTALMIHGDNEPQAGCSDKDFKGTYGFVSQGTNVTNQQPFMAAGTLTADGRGNITAWKDLATVPATPPIVPPNFKVVTPVRDILAMAASLGNGIHYKVEPDCRLTIRTAILVPELGNAVVPIVQFGTLTSRGQEALLVNSAPGSPFLTSNVMKRSGN